MIDKKVLIVEGITDKTHLEKIIIEKIDIVCTHGTLGVEKFDELLEVYNLDYRDVFILVDADEPGMELRKQLTRELPNAQHLYIEKDYKEVALTPQKALAQALHNKHIQVNPIYLR